MKRKRFTEEQIIGILKQAEAGGSNQEICRKNGITEQTLYRWRAKYAGMCRDERDPINKLVRPTQRRKAAQHLIEMKMRSERRACDLINIRRSVFRYESRRDDSALRQRLMALAAEYPRLISDN